LIDLAERRAKANLPVLVVDLPILLGAGHLSDFRYTTELEINTRKGFQPSSVFHVCEMIGTLLASQGGHITLDNPQWSAMMGVTKYARLIQHNTGRVKTIKLAAKSKAGRRKKTKVWLNKSFSCRITHCHHIPLFVDLSVFFSRFSLLDSYVFIL